MINPDSSRRRIAVLGGGIAGLTAAYELARGRQAGAAIEEFVINANDRLGGVIWTEKIEGFVVEAGPDSFLTEKPEAAALCRELGIGNSLVGSNDADRRTYILHREQLVPLPDGLMLFAPTRIAPIIETPLLPLGSKLQMAAEWLMRPPVDNQPGDESVARFVRRHFGNAMFENVAEPLLAGVYGGDSACLSARSVLGRFWQMEKKYGSLTRGVLDIRRQRMKAARVDPATISPATAPLFTTLKDGLGQMIEELSKRLDASRVHFGRRVQIIEPVAAANARRFRIVCFGGSVHAADAIVLALPAHECSRLLAALDGSLAELLGTIPYASAMTVALGFGADALRQLPPGFGLLVPRKEGRRLLACTFVHAKFSHRAPPGRALLRCFLGGSRDPEVLNIADDAAVALVRQELNAILNFSAEPLFSRVYRWPASMAQYVVGHEDVVNQIQARLENHPSLALAGNAYSGIGISDCVRTGRAAAERVLKSITA